MDELREVPPEEWAKKSLPDVYFTYQYYEASSFLEPDYSRVVLLEGKDQNGSVLLPLIIRRIPNSSYFDATSAYGYGGPWVEGRPDCCAFARLFDEWAEENMVVSSFLRYHPILRNANDFKEVLPVRRVGPTAGWAISQNESLVAGMSKSHRKAYRRSIRAGVETRVTRNPVSIEDFKELYNQSMNRLSAAGFYHFSDEYWHSMLRSLGPSTVLVEARFDDRVVAAVLCLVTENFLHYHLSGTSDEGRKLDAAVLCRVAAAEWGRDKGVRIAHFGGGVGGENSPLLSWKRRFDESLPLYDFHVSNIIHQEEIYYQQSVEYADKDFFPPWRSPNHVNSSR